MTYPNTTFSFEVEVRNERQGGVDVHTMDRGLRDRVSLVTKLTETALVVLKLHPHLWHLVLRQ